MGNIFGKDAPPPVVIVPPLFDFPPLSARTRMLESPYDVLFGKLALRCLFEDYFAEAKRFSTSILLKPVDDANVDLIATLSGPVEHKPEENILGNALFRWQSDVDDHHAFMDLFVSNSNPILRARSCIYYPKYGLGTFGIFPLLLKQRILSEDYGIIGLRYGSETLSIGATVTPFFSRDDCPRSAWFLGKKGSLIAGAQYQHQDGSKDIDRFINHTNWSYAVGYGVGSGSPLSPSFNFCLEYDKNSQFIASFYQHFVVQRRVKNPFEENEVVGITNYIDFGFELRTRVDNAKSSNSIYDSVFQVAASWQANKNILLKGKLGPLSSSVTFAFKSWWKPSFTFSVSAVRDRVLGSTNFGFGLRVENLREASYESADPNFVMFTPSKEHLAIGPLWQEKKKTIFESDVNSGNFDAFPTELRPFDKIL